MLIHKSIFYIFCLCSIVFADSGVIFKGHVGSKPGWAFQGKLFRNASTVYISPDFKAIPVQGISKSMSICGFAVHHNIGSFFPFVILVTDHQLGYGEIKLKSNIENDILKSSYTFQIEAYDCDLVPHYSKRKFVVIDIKGIQRPIFTASSYHFLAKSNTAVGTKIGSVTAFERPEKIELDSSSEGICKYVIISTSTVPFNIDKFGSLLTKVLVLDNTKSTRYRFTVQANDCRKPYPTTNSVPVTVDVFDDCEPQWTGLTPSVDYDIDKGVLPLVMNNLGSPSLHLCSGKCQSMLAVVSVKLQGRNLRPAKTDLCKLDDRSLKRQETLCDISKNAIDVMTMAPEHLKEKRTGGYSFDGNIAVNVDSKFNKFGHGAVKKFTVMFWMKHAKMAQGGPKEQILCNSDGQEHNRHHLSLFLHNCKLILLLRKEFGETKRDKYEPSEWRYGPLSEVCDDKWHHYALLFNDGSVLVQIDGEMTTGSPQSLDDKPLFESPPGKRDTKFTVAACYHAKSNNFVQFFRGHLASLKIIDGQLEAMNNIRCIATCGEALLLPHVVDVVGFQSSVTIFSDSIVFRSDDVYNLLKMFSGLSYINTDILEEIHGLAAVNRTVTITTEIHCDGNKVSTVAPRSIFINLRNSSGKAAKLPTPIGIFTNVNISGFQNERIPLFGNLKFIKYKKDIDSVQSCIVRPVGLDFQHWEYLEWPIDLIINLHLTGLNNSHGLVLEGRQQLGNYEMILRKVYYVTRKSDKIVTNRMFAASCSIIDKLVTDEVIVSLEVKPRDLKTYYIIDDPVENDDDSKSAVEHQAKSDGKMVVEKVNVMNKVSMGKKTTTTVVWVVLVCLLAVVLGTVVGLILFYRKFKRHSLKGFLVNFNKRGQLRMKVTPNPLVTEGVGVGDIEIGDDDSLVDDVPYSMDEFDDDEFGSELDCGESKDRVTIPRSLRIPLAVHGASVDV